MPIFTERITHLMNEVGDGTLTMGTVVQQPYAAAEHERLYYRHPRGGMAKYLELPLIANRDFYVGILALNAVTPEGSNLRSAAEDVAERMAGITRRYAPVLSGLLRDSADAYVLDAGALIYYREGPGPYNYDKE